MAVMLNTGMSGTMTASVTDEMTRKMLEDTLVFLANTPPASFLVSIVERLAAVALHISLSVLVWFAAKDKGRFWLYPLAVILHAVIDVVAVIMVRNGLNAWNIEIVLYMITACFIVIARIVWKKSVCEQVNRNIISEAGA